jgi:hypothetical protein
MAAAKVRRGLGSTSIDAAFDWGIRRAQDGERSTELAASEIIAGADLVAPSTANITGGLYRRGGRRCSFGRLSATFCECRLAPSTQVKTADLARHS